MAHPVEALLRKPVEFWSASTALVLAGVAWVLQDYMLFTPVLGKSLTMILLVFGIYRAVGGFRIERYQRRLGYLAPFSLKEIPTRKKGIYFGLGFLWTQRHTQRLRDTRTGDGMVLLESLRRRRRRTAIGGTPELHTVGLWGQGEHPIWLDEQTLKGHRLIVGSTGSGKTRLAEIMVEQDIRRGCTVIVFDPKGDADLLARVYSAARRSGRLQDFKIIHLAHPKISARYNPIGSFTRITQVAQRLSQPLPDQGDSAAFREFAWIFSNIIARAMVKLGETPDYVSVRRYAGDMEPLLLRYMALWLEEIGESARWTAIQNAPQGRSRTGYSERAKEAAKIARQLLNAEKISDPVVEGLVKVIEYDKGYYDKLVSSLLPLLEKLTTGAVGELLSPSYSDSEDKREIIDWGTVIRRRRIVYVGLDALTDPVVAGAVGQAMFEDLSAVAGELYAYGENFGGEVSENDHAKPPVLPEKSVCIHADELSAIASESVLNILARGRGAGMELSCYTQTVHDLATGLGNRDLARVAIGNMNTLIMLRVRDDQTARLLTDELPKVDVQQLMNVSGANDSSMPTSDVEFTSSTQQRITTKEVSMLDPGDVMRLPIGNAFLLGEGGQLYKTRLPLPGRVEDTLPVSVAKMVESMRSRPKPVPRWWDIHDGRRLNRRDGDVDFSGSDMDSSPSLGTDMGAYVGVEGM